MATSTIKKSIVATNITEQTNEAGDIIISSFPDKFISATSLTAGIWCACRVNFSGTAIIARCMTIDNNEPVIGQQVTIKNVSFS